MFKQGDIVRGIWGYDKKNKFVITNVRGSVVTMKDLKTSFIVTTYKVNVEHDLEFTRRLKIEQIKKSTNI